MKSHCPVPWHRALLARMPRGLYRRVQGFEAAIEDGVSEFGRSLPRGTRVLDSGAGEGQYAHAFGHCRYVGVDLGVGDEDWDYSQINVRADLRRLPFRDDSFAAAVNIVVLEHVVEPQTVLAEISRVLQTGAPLFLVVPQELNESPAAGTQRHCGQHRQRGESSEHRRDGGASGRSAADSAHL